VELTDKQKAGWVC